MNKLDFTFLAKRYRRWRRPTYGCGYCHHAYNNHTFKEGCKECNCVQYKIGLRPQKFITNQLNIRGMDR